jgi:hypothetical protein
MSTTDQNYDDAQNAQAEAFNKAGKDVNPWGATCSPTFYSQPDMKWAVVGLPGGERAYGADVERAIAAAWRFDGTESGQ